MGYKLKTRSMTLAILLSVSGYKPMSQMHLSVHVYAHIQIYVDRREYCGLVEDLGNP